MGSPFQFGRELGMGALVDRAEEVAAVEQTIREAGKLFLVGPRRFGKTSILKTAADRLTAESAIVLRLDAESYPTLDLLVTAIVTGAARHLKGGVKRAGEQARRFFQSLRPELDYSASTGTWSGRLGVDSSRQDQTVLLTEALNGLEKLARAQPKNRPVGLIIDEFQRVIELGGKVAEGQIRAAIQTHSRVGYVFAGSKTRMLNDMVSDAARPFYRLGSKIFLGPVPREDFTRFLKEKFLESGFSVDDRAIIHLLDLAEDVPYNVQMLAHGCWSRLRDDGTAHAHPLSESFVAEPATTMLVTAHPSQVAAIEDLAAQYSFFTARIGTTGGEHLEIGVYREPFITAPLSSLTKPWADALEATLHEEVRA